MPHNSGFYGNFPIISIDLSRNPICWRLPGRGPCWVRCPSADELIFPLQKMSPATRCRPESCRRTTSIATWRGRWNRCPILSSIRPCRIAETRGNSDRRKLCKVPSFHPLSTVSNRPTPSGAIRGLLARWETSIGQPGRESRACRNRLRVRWLPSRRFLDRRF